MLEGEDPNPTPADQTAPDQGAPAAQPDAPPVDRASEGAGEDLRSPIERRLDEIANTEDLSTLRRQPQGHDIPEGPEQLPAGWTRDTQGRLRDGAGNFAKIATEDPAAAGGGEGGEADPAPAAVAPVKLWLPGRGPQDADVELELTPEALTALEPALAAAGITVQQLTESVSQAKNGYARKAQLTEERRVFDREREDVRLIERELANPKTAADFVMTRVAPATRVEVARQILASMPVKEFEALMETATGWDRDRTARTTAAVQEENRRLKTAETTRSERQAAQADVAAASVLSQAIEELIPLDWPQEKGQHAYEYALHRLIGHLDKTGADVTAAQIPALMKQLGVISLLGLPEPGAPPVAAAPAAAAASKPDAAAADRARQHGQNVAARVQRRQDAAAVSPSGSGTPIRGTRPPRGQTFEERIKWVAEHGVPS